MSNRVEVVVDVLDEHYRNASVSGVYHERCACGHMDGRLEDHVAEMVLNALDDLEAKLERVSKWLLG